MEQRATFLALILLDALEDEHESNIMEILEKNASINPSFVPADRGISPMHYVCGMDNEALGLKFVKIFLERGGDPNVCSCENITPLHVASMHGRVEIVRLLMEHGAKLDAMDNDRKLPLHYAIEECHFEVVQLMRDKIFLNKYEQRGQVQPQKPKLMNDGFQSKKSSTPNEHLQVPLQHEESLDKFTPSRIYYNYDVTSPYFINITHRRNKPQPKFPSPEKCYLETQTQSGNETFNISTIDSSPDTVTRPINIFSLTKENVAELSHANQEKERSRISLVEIWREKVKRSNARKSILREFDDVQEMIQTVMENDHLNFTNTKLFESKVTDTESDNDSGACLPQVPATSSSNENLAAKTKNNMSLGQLIQRVVQAQLVKPDPEPTQQQQAQKTVSSFLTVPEMEQNMHNSSNFIRSPNQSEYYLAMSEAYVHTDDEHGVVFYETKFLSNPSKRVAANGPDNMPNNSPLNLDGTLTTQSTEITLPLDYETDALRSELTTFGEPPGPITESTKRLYIKRLIKIKRKTAAEMEEVSKKKTGDNKIKFSVELYRSVRCLESFQSIVESYMKYDKLSAEYFANHQNKRSMREGHLKQSFIYMLIDPRISCNLPGESIYLNKFEIWKRFLDSIFYVGKGKTSRPYSHLYEAMKLHSRLHNVESNELQKNGKKISIKKQKLNMDLFKKSTSHSTADQPLSQKIQRILDIWSSNRGVVCLHIFHNIMPTDAMTREASIIEALGLNHLTNAKRGDYYGPAKNWTMKEKKFLGIALLYKAMKIYLAEGESQLSPSDLI